MIGFRRSGLGPVLAFIVAASTIGVAAPSPALAVSVPTDMAGHWRFDEASGPTATDSSSNAIHGSITGATRITGKDGGALSFDGSGDRVTAPDATALEPMWSVTVAAWVRASTAQPANAIIVAKGAGDCGESSYALETGPNGLPRFSVTADGTTSSSAEATEPIWDGAWHHVVGWRSGSQLLVVVDALGIAFGTAAVPLQYGLPSDELVIGGPPPSCPSGPAFSGAIDDVRIYARDLSLDEIGTFQPPVATTLELEMSPLPYEYCDEGGRVTATVTPAPYYFQPVQFTITSTAGVTHYMGFTNDDGVAHFDACGYLNIGQTTITAEMEPRIIWLGSSDTMTVAVTKQTTTVVIEPVPDLVAGEPATLHMSVLPWSDRPLRVFEVVDGQNVLLGTAPYPFGTNYQFDLGTPAAGTHTYKVTYPGDAWTKSSTGTVTVEVGLREPDLIIEASPNPAEEGTPVDVAFWSTDPLASGPVTILDVTDPARPILVSRGVRLPPGTGTGITTTALQPGVRTLVGRLSATTTSTVAWSDPVTVTITPDTSVKATGVTSSPATFYPYPDGYIDGVTVSGNLQESARVVVSIFNGAGTKVRTIDLGQKAGPYSGKWDGKNNAGAAVPAGAYKIVQTLTDLRGNKLDVATNATASPKRLYFTTTSKTLDGVAFSASGIEGTGKIVGSAYGGGIKLRSGTAGSARAGWQFTLPAATVYKSLSFSVLGSGSVPPGSIAVANWTLCGEWADSCFDSVAGAPIAYGWATTTATPAEHISGGRVVRGAVFAFSYVGLETIVDVRDVKVTYTYGVLK